MTRNPYLPSMSVIEEATSLFVFVSIRDTYTGSRGLFVIESYTVPHFLFFLLIPRAPRRSPNIFAGISHISDIAIGFANVTAVIATLPPATTPAVDTVFVIADPTGVFIASFVFSID